MTQDNYEFQWSDLGDIEIGRPTLGNSTYVSVYRMLQFSVRSAITAMYGSKAAKQVFYNAGELAGREFCANVLDKEVDACTFFSNLAIKLNEFNIGIMTLEYSDDDKRNYTVSIEEDLDCSGLPNNNETVCGFDEGFIAGILKEFMGIEFLVREIDCWSMGQKLCRFEIKSA